MMFIVKIEKTEEEIQNTVHSILKEIGIKIHVSGFKMWTTAALCAIALANSGADKCRMDFIYNYVAREHKSTVYKVERNLRYALSEADKERIKKYFNVNYKIDNSAFLSLLLIKIAERLKVIS